MSQALLTRFAFLADAIGEGGPEVIALDDLFSATSFEEAWRLSPNAVTLMKVAGALAPKHELIRAACACVGTVRGLLPSGDSRPARALAAAEGSIDVDTPYEVK